MFSPLAISLLALFTVRSYAVFHLAQKSEFGDGNYITSEFTTFHLQKGVCKDGRLFVELLLLALVAHISQ